MPHVIVVGTSSALKMSAVRDACLLAGVVATVVPRPSPSRVNAQPVGREEIILGARNRARGAREGSTGAWSVGIENGVVLLDGRWLDVAAIVLLSPDGTETVRWSEAVAVPEGYVARAEAEGFERTTVGAIVARDLGSSPDDPHAALTAGRRPRAAILAETLAAAFAAVPQEGVRSMKTTHRIEIGGVVRELPVREVAPGVRVALFNILGDWLLAEAAGKALSAKLPRGVTALVMPDGKATALLHVMGRMTGLPTFVARKEKKPYMAEPVVGAEYRSITTNRVQTLFLGADDASALEGTRVVIVDDVVSTGGTLSAMKALLAEVGAEVVGVAAVFTEGGAREDVTALGDLPLF
jgi:adenine phosphoribosyltransferase